MGFLFSRCQCSALKRELDELRVEVSKCQSAIRTYQTEQVTMHDQVRKWMRRAVAAERAAEANQEPAAAPVTPQLAARSPAMTGARARRWRRLARPDPLAASQDDQEPTDGLAANGGD